MGSSVSHECSNCDRTEEIDVSTSGLMSSAQEVVVLPVCSSTSNFIHSTPPSNFIPSTNLDAFSFTIEKPSSAEKLGLCIRFYNGCARVHDIARDGLIFNYNEGTSMTERVLVGDQVLHVNGKYGKEMLNEIQNATTVNIEIARRFQTLLLKKHEVDGRLGFQLEYNPSMPICKVAQITDEQKVDLQGLSIGDHIIRVNDKEGVGNSLVHELQSAKELTVTILRQK